MDPAWSDRLRTPMYWLRLVLGTSSESLKFIKNMHMFSFEPSSYFYHKIRQDTQDFPFSHLFSIDPFEWQNTEVPLVDNGYCILLAEFGSSFEDLRGSVPCSDPSAARVSQILCHHGYIVALRENVTENHFHFGNIVFFLQKLFFSFNSPPASHNQQIHWSICRSPKADAKRLKRIETTNHKYM